MRYLTLAANYTESCIMDDFTGPIGYINLNLPKELIQKLETWNESYKLIIPMEFAERETYKDRINSLDKQGLELKKEILELTKDDIKVRYYSEGKQKFLE